MPDKPKCSCGAYTLAEHVRKVKAGYPAHEYEGFSWGPPLGPRR